MKKQLIWKLATLALIVAVVAFAYQFINKDGFTNNVYKSVDDFKDFVGMAVFTKEDCPHCINMKDTITSLKKKYPSEFVEFDTSSGDPGVMGIMTKYKVNKYPSILLFNGAEPTEYQGERTATEMGAAIDANRPTA